MIITSNHDPCKILGSITRCEIKASEPLVPYRETVLTPLSGILGPGSNENKGDKVCSYPDRFKIFSFGKFCYNGLQFFITVFPFLFLSFSLPLTLSLPPSPCPCPCPFPFHSLFYSHLLILLVLPLTVLFLLFFLFLFLFLLFLLFLFLFLNVLGVSAKILPPPWSDLSGLCDAVQGRVRFTSSSDYLAITIRCYPLPAGKM